MKGKIFLFIIALFLLPASYAGHVKLSAKHPVNYTVKRGDTLWDISGKFLQKPWHWPEIWNINPQISNPHLIYPGDILSLRYHNGRPYLNLQSRHGRRAEPVTTISMRTIKPFLSNSLVVQQGELSGAAYILSQAGEHVITGGGDKIYARRLKDPNVHTYNIFREGEAYRDGATRKILGFAALNVGEAQLVQAGDPATLMLTKTHREVLVGDRLIPKSEIRKLHFAPRTAKNDIKGQIISMIGGVNQIGQYQVVVIDRGNRDGVGEGDVLAIYKVGDLVRDPVGGNGKELIRLPDVHEGELLVFRTFDRVSFGVVMRATHAIHVFDRVTNAA